jgi:hypothetical protein
MIFCDLDEYMFIPEKPLILYINENPYIYKIGFKNNWVENIDKNFIFEKIPFEFPHEILVSEEKFHYPKRSKNIYKINCISTIGIHNDDHSIYNENDFNVFNMYHFYSLSGKRKNSNKINNYSLVKTSTNIVTL